jgi:hypothetical protein
MSMQSRIRRQRTQVTLLHIVRDLVHIAVGEEDGI